MTVNTKGQISGLDLSKAFFFEWGLPYIEKEFKDIKEKIAVGCFEGSQALQADDSFSQDHAWGPSFHIYLDDDYEIDDQGFVAQICNAAPKEFMGIQRLPHEMPIRLHRTNHFFESIFSGSLPKENFDWIHRKPETRESRLYFIKHGALFFDASGTFSKLRATFSHYPPDILSMRMASCCNTISHFGEYNFCHRVAKRSDSIPIQIALGNFIEAVIRMYFYLENDFAPYWKWLAFEFRKRKLSLSTQQELDKLTQLNSSKQIQVVLKICDELKDRMVKAGVIPEDIEKSDRVEIPLFFRIMKHIRSGISDNRIKRFI